MTTPFAARALRRLPALLRRWAVVCLVLCLPLQAVSALVAGVFVLRGGYHAPSDVEKHELDEDVPATQPVAA